MSEAHTAFQHGIVGVAVASFAAVGYWIVAPEHAAQLIGQLDQTKWAALGTVLVSPLIGMAVQAAVLFALYCFSHPYDGDPRRLVSQRVHDAIDNSRHASAELRKRIHDAPIDSLFVWYYYSNAPEHLIEWARRRRDGQHLGENLIGAACFGIAAGLVAGATDWTRIASTLGHGLLTSLVLLGTAFWIGGLMFLRRNLRHDAESMELVWAYAAIDPTFRQAIELPQTPSKSAPDSVHSAQ